MTAGGVINEQPLVLQSCFQAPVSYWRVTLCLPVLFPSSFPWQEKNWHKCYSYLSSISPAGAAHTFCAYTTSLKLFFCQCMCSRRTAVDLSPVYCKNTTVDVDHAMKTSSSSLMRVIYHTAHINGWGVMVKSFAHETIYQSHPEFWHHIFGSLQSQ